MGCAGSKDAAAKYAVDENGDRVTRVSPPKASRSSLNQGSAARSEAHPSKPDARPNVANYAPKKAKLDPKDFQFIGCKSQVLVKAPGSINGQAFTIDGCQDCDMYLLDSCAQVNIDDCKNCRIFIGPCAGSIFLRSSSNVQCAFVTRQLRLRDVTQASISLLCRTQPILESSSEIKLGCYSLCYPALPGQLKAAKLDWIHNFWWWPYDFTPTASHPHWTYLDADQDTESVLGGLPEAVTQAMGEPVKESGLIVTWGDRPNPPGTCYLFSIFTKADAATQFINQAKHQGTVLTTNSAVCPDEVMDNMAAKAGWNRGAERTLLVPGPCIGVELRCSEAAAKTLGSAAHVLGGQHSDNPEVGLLFRKLGLEGAG